MENFEIYPIKFPFFSFHIAYHKTNKKCDLGIWVKETAKIEYGLRKQDNIKYYKSS